MKRIVVVGDVAIFASQGQSQRCHSRHLSVGYGALVGNPCIARLKNTIAIVSSLVSSWHVRKTGTIIDNFQFAATKVLNVIFTMFIMFSLGCFLKI